ncbi:MAG: hypothetical protein ACRDKZ_11070, partial [Actinomycetota bacterium]
WIKAYPCCLQTHSSIEAAAKARAAGMTTGPIDVTVHPVSRQAAPYDDVTDALQAKFSIPHTVAYTLLHGPPGVRDFAEIDQAVRKLAEWVVVRTDRSLLESEARFTTPEGFETRVESALGSPDHPMTTEQLTAKVHDLAGDALDGVLDEPHEPAKRLLDAACLS